MSGQAGHATRLMSLIHNSFNGFNRFFREEQPENQNWVPAFAGTTWLGAFKVRDGCEGDSRTFMRLLRSQ